MSPSYPSLITALRHLNPPQSPSEPLCSTPSEKWIEVCKRVAHLYARRVGKTQIRRQPVSLQNPLRLSAGRRKPRRYSLLVSDGDGRLDLLFRRVDLS